MKFRLLATLGSVVIGAPAFAAGPQQVASDTIATAGGEVEQVIVTGTREVGLKAADSAAPIQILSAQDIAAASGSPDLINTLAKIVPSLTAQSFGGDQANQTLQAKLRGLSPNDALVLINGKRRHTAANLAVLGGPFQGGAGVDLNFIPVGAIDHIEVLTEGAAAQYGSDAIAGVINIILKKGYDGGDVTATYGGYFDGGGVTGDVAATAGFKPADDAYLNFAAEVRNHGHSDRGGIDARLLNPARTYPNTNEESAPGYPRLNKIFGDAEYHSKIVTFNSALGLAGGAEFYAFGSYGRKDANSFENYRTPSTVTYTGPLTGGVKNYLFPFGFSPREAISETDYDASGGVRGQVADWNWDFSSNYGANHADIYTLDSANASIAGGYTDVLGNVIPGTNSTPRDFYDGFFKATQWTTNLDFNRALNGGFAGLVNVAFGAEYRRNSYAIGAGEPSSYAGGGAQSYPGFQPSDASSHSRNNYAGYVDLAAKPVDALRLDLAARYENYSDFGSKVVGKLTGRFDFTPTFALRGTVSTGFRAPTLAEEYYRATNVSPDSASVQLQPNSLSAADLGLGAGLQPETSRNYSFGIVFRPSSRLIATLDLYQIDIKDRIVASGTLNSVINGIEVSPAITQAIKDSGAVPPSLVVPGGSYSVNLFTNGINTRTRGADFVLDLPVDHDWGKVDWSVGATYTDTTITSIRPSPAQLANQPVFTETGSALFDKTALSDLTTASPKYVLNLGALLSVNRWTVNLREVIYGETVEAVSDGGVTPTGVVSTVTYYDNRVSAAAITNLDVSFAPSSSVKLSAGASNLFNKYPDHVNATIYEGLLKNYRRGTVSTYPSISPFGINGGYYYVRASYGF